MSKAKIYGMIQNVKPNKGNVRYVPKANRPREWKGKDKEK